MFSDHIPEGNHIPEGYYITLVEARERHHEARRKDSPPPDEYQQLLNKHQTLAEWNAAVSPHEERRIRPKVERWLSSEEEHLADAFQKGKLKAIYRLPKSEQNMAVQPRDWNDKAWQPARPFHGPVVAFPYDPWFKFAGRTLFVEETSFMRWLLGKAEAPPISKGLPKCRVSERSLRSWYKDRVRNWPNDKEPPTEPMDIEAAKAFFKSEAVSRELIRNIRRECAPPSWLKRGPRSL